MEVTIFATTDIHGSIYPYNYFDQQEKNESLLKFKSYIDTYKNAKKDALILTVDNGDLLQGDTWNDYDVQSDGEYLLPKIINDVYDVISIGNHEFNFGFEFLYHLYKQVNVPIVNSNIEFHNKINELVVPHVIKEVETAEGTVKVGFLSVVPPKVMIWDMIHFRNDDTIAHPMYEKARENIIELRQKGADIVILLAHTGLKEGVDVDDHEAENQAFLYLETLHKEAPFDGMVVGHTHEKFPSTDLFLSDESVDIAHGLIHGVPVVQPGVSASDIGQITFNLEKQNGQWVIVEKSAALIPSEAMPLTEDVGAPYKHMHEAVLRYISEPIAHIDETWHTYFSQVYPTKAVQVVAEATKRYTSLLVDNGQIEGRPILMVNAPTKAGRDSGNDYSVINRGELRLSDAIDLYKHANTLVVLKIDGVILKEWLEWSASQFRTNGEDNLLLPNSSKNGFPCYNFDMFYNVDYLIDISKSPRYDGSGNKISNNERVVSMQFEGEDIKDTDEFLVPANNYRATNTPFFLHHDVEVVFESTTPVRDILIQYLRENRDFELRRPFKILPEKKYLFESSTRASEFIENESIEFVKDLGDGYSMYRVDYQS